ncbi:unnamed protein product [Symbiodinium necroappetens]|uniref:DUF7869 domain-containing protein n=1 Tax=Symbiodinium necroappetens TaxID=1628268 RepID=A0A812NU54_9DINO|nr:unnamed protein product [Symbiodinium necroappetens]
MLRELALSQQVMLPGSDAQAVDDESVPKSANLRYSFLGHRVCKEAFAALLGVGWNPRLTTMLKAVLQNRRSAPVDRRYMARPENDPKPVYGEVVSYLQSLYESVAETLPFEQADDDADEPDVYRVNATVGDELRYLPPGSMYDTWRQYTASAPTTCSWHTFHNAWTKEFKHKLTFRNKYTFGICPTCLKHKLLLRHLGSDAVARHRQRLVYDRHLAAQFADRRCYWAMRASSRLHHRSITMIVDAIDQAKFSCPRSPIFGHSFEKYCRPRLHVWGLICHGWCAHVAVSDADTSKGASTLVDLVLFALERLRRRGARLQEFELNIQLDNTASCNKNNTVMAMAATLASLQLVAVVRLTFLRVGHTHEDIDQWLGELAGFVRRKLPVSETPDLLVQELNAGFMRKTRCKQWMADSAYTSRLVYLTGADMLKLPGSHATGFLPRRPMPEKYKKMIHGLASAITTHPFTLHRAAAYLRGWVEGTLTKAAPLDFLELRSPTSPTATAAVHARPAGRMQAMPLEPEQSTVRVLAATSHPVGSMKMVLINSLAKSLRDDGMQAYASYQQAYRMWSLLPPSVQTAMESSEAGTAETADVAEAEVDDSSVPLQAEYDRELGDLDVTKALQASESLPWWPKAVELLNKIMSDKGAADFFLKEFPTAEARKEFAETLKDAFPLPAGESFSKDYSPGIKTIQTWQTCYRPQGGNKGLIPNEYFQNHCILILLEGMKTDAAVIPGTEYLVLGPLCPLYFDEAWETAELEKNAFQAQSVGFVKGWSRSLAMCTVAYILVQLDLVQYYRDHLPAQFRSFCYMKGMVPAEVERIAANSMTLSSVMTRAAPNAFNSLHQLYRRVKHGETVEDIVHAYQAPKSVKSVLGMGPAESQALVNLVHFIPKQAQAILSMAAVEFGMKRGVISHAGLGCAAMRVGYAPSDVAAPEWKERLTCTSSSIILCCERLVGDWKKTAPSMRKTSGPTEVTKMSKICRCWEIVIAQLRGQLTSDQFNKSHANLHEAFLNASFDDQLQLITEECPAVVNLKDIPDIATVLELHSTEIEKAAIEKSRALQIQVEAATFAKMEEDLAQDLHKLVRWAKEEHARTSTQASLVLTHQRKRYVKGLQAVEAHTEQWLRIRTCNIASWPMELADFRKNLFDKVTVSPSKRLVLMVLDMSLSPTNTEIDDMIKTAASILHASGQNALFVLLPQQYNKSQSMSSVLAAQRRIEDKLMAQQVNFESHVSIHYNIENMHGSDKRRLSTQARFAVSQKVDADAWLESTVARGKLENIPLLTVRKMRKLSMPGAVNSADRWELSPQDRLIQRGPKATAAMIEGIVANSPANGRDTMLTVVEARMSPNSADWAEGCWLLQKEWATQTDKPQISYLGFSKEASPAKPHMQSLLMEEWWPQQPHAGTLEPDSRPTEHPTLALATFQDGVPSLPPIVLSKFDDNETYSTKWNTLVTEFRNTVKAEVMPRITVVPSPTASNAGSVSTTVGPDFNFAPFPEQASRVIFPNVPKASWQEDNVPLGGSAQPNPDDVVMWDLSSDVDKIVVEIEEGTRKFCTVAEARHYALTTLNIPDIGLQNYAASPLKDGDREVFMRCTLEPSANSYLFFTPSNLSDDQVAEGLLKRDVLGAVFVGCMKKLLEMENVKIVWRCMFQTQVPAMIKPVKPKLFLACSTQLEAGFFYRLT